MENTSILYVVLSGCFFFPLLCFFTALAVPALTGVVFIVLAVGFHIIRFCRFIVTLYIFKYIFDICSNFTMTQYFLLFLGCMWIFFLGCSWMSFIVISKYLKNPQRHRRRHIRTIIHTC